MTFLEKRLWQFPALPALEDLNSWLTCSSHSVYHQFSTPGLSAVPINTSALFFLPSLTYQTQPSRSLSSQPWCVIKAWPWSKDVAQSSLPSCFLLIHIIKFDCSAAQWLLVCVWSVYANGTRPNKGHWLHHIHTHTHAHKYDILSGGQPWLRWMWALTVTN